MAHVELDDKQLVLLALLCERHVDRVPELAQANIKALARILRMARDSNQKGE